MKRLILVLVTDGAHARVLEQKNEGEPLYQVDNKTHNSQLAHEQGRDRPGRVFESATTARHAHEPAMDLHERQKVEFVQELAPLIIKMHAEKKYSKIYVICPPRIMGMMRASLNPSVNKEPLKERPNIQEVTKDLTHHTIQEIEDYIKDL